MPDNKSAFRVSVRLIHLQPGNAGVEHITVVGGLEYNIPIPPHAAAFGTLYVLDKAAEAVNMAFNAKEG